MKLIKVSVKLQTSRSGAAEVGVWVNPNRITDDLRERLRRLDEELAEKNERIAELEREISLSTAIDMVAWHLNQSTVGGSDRTRLRHAREIMSEIQSGFWTALHPKP